MKGRLAKEIAIVTGAGSGIGRASAELFAEEGAKVVVADLNLEAAQKVAAGIGSEAIAVGVNVADTAQVEAMVAEVLRSFGVPTVLFNNAGVMPEGDIVHTDDAAWLKAIEVNLGGVMRCCRAVLPHMIRAGRGSIVNMSSVVGIVGNPGIAAYSAAKGGVLALTRAMAIDHAAQGIRVNAISPGTTQTGVLEAYLANQADPERSRRGFDQIHPLGRIASPREVAQVALFLASGESSFVTGANYVVDGGYTVKGSMPK